LVSVAFFANRYILHGFSGKDSTEYYDMGIWSKQHSADRIGILQSGIAGFVAPNVINLDGKVNVAALRAHQQGKLGEYIKREHFLYIADWKDFVEDIAAMAREAGAPYDSIGRIGHFQIMRRAEIQ